ncbi:hypothetical protein [Acetilactobacillus jinshanensis]|uniref:Uncharacterized protein n=1 Tax=Acetilactobacillus jinshanensis TaxID=1720083 RepID=A0A4P6ZKK9_9LACO|nr:hypothetical protein [Acetilactobacillus jinshanensis]QBP18224.1 hypothetical protein ELX58_03530 [Acetilactobacillus jinshanensis]URL61094.1 hypothetical protein HGK75_03605 [uncultured bacterium]
MLTQKVIDDLHKFLDDVHRYFPSRYLYNYDHHHRELNRVNLEKYRKRLTTLVSLWPIDCFHKHMAEDLISLKHLNKYFSQPMVSRYNGWDGLRHAAEVVNLVFSHRAHYLKLTETVLPSLSAKLYSVIEVAAETKLNHHYASFGQCHVYDVYLDKRQNGSNRSLIIYSVHLSTVSRKILKVIPYRDILLRALNEYFETFQPSAKDGLIDQLGKIKSPFVTTQRSGLQSNITAKRLGRYSTNMKCYRINQQLYQAIQGKDQLSLNHEEFVALLDCLTLNPKSPKGLTKLINHDCQRTAPTKKEFELFSKLIQ